MNPAEKKINVKINQSYKNHRWKKNCMKKNHIDMNEYCKNHVQTLCMNRVKKLYRKQIAHKYIKRKLEMNDG